MAIWDRFRRENRKSLLPEEVKQYYQTENKQKRGVAIVLAVVALIVTVALATALFFGGRFIYNKITGDDNKTEQKAPEGSGDFDRYVNEQQKTQNNQNQNQNNQQGQSNQGQNLQGSQNQPNNQPAQNPTTPALGDESLPHTGDEGL